MNNSVLWYTTRGAGAVTLILLTTVVILGILSTLRLESDRWPRFLTTGLHRNLALMTLVFLALHIVTAVVDPFTNLGWTAALIPFSSYYRTFWLGLGVIAFELILAIVVTSLVRGGLGHSAWRAIHWLTYAAWPIGVIHGMGTGTDTWSAWMLGITAACIAAVGVAVVLRINAGSTDPLAAARSSFRAAVDRKETPR
ncbi:MAG TPA: ferric reductase-like transmembrane domain-containing protein [Candidatus Dormibacteraeota bacterium]|nr:ferric reductase-like transmembrane domain-containing protein [Candidatus Dormibacteraeota bacterium]